jgi:hypothetical protein
LSAKSSNQRTYPISDRLNALESAAGLQNIAFTGLISQCYLDVKDQMRIEIMMRVFGIAVKEILRSGKGTQYPASRPWRTVSHRKWFGLKRPANFPQARFWIVSELTTTRPCTVFRPVAGEIGPTPSTFVQQPGGCAPASCGSSWQVTDCLGRVLLQASPFSERNRSGPRQLWEGRIACCSTAAYSSSPLTMCSSSGLVLGRNSLPGLGM